MRSAFPSSRDGGASSAAHFHWTGRIAAAAGASGVEAEVGEHEGILRKVPGAKPRVPGRVGVLWEVGVYSPGTNFNDTPFMQYRNPVGFGPSGKTWPRWPPQRAQWTSVRTWKKLRSVSVPTLASLRGA